MHGVRGVKGDWFSVVEENRKAGEAQMVNPDSLSSILYSYYATEVLVRRRSDLLPQRCVLCEHTQVSESLPQR